MKDAQEGTGRGRLERVGLVAIGALLVLVGPSGVSTALSIPWDLPEIDHYPQLVTNGTGVWVVAWRHGQGNAGSVLTARSLDNGEHWEGPVVIDLPWHRPGDRDGFYRGRGRVLLRYDRRDGWVVFVGGEIFASRDNGATWRSVGTLPVCDGNIIRSIQDVASDGNGIWLAACEVSHELDQTKGTHIFVFRSRGGLAVWEMGESLTERIAVEKKQWGWHFHDPRIASEGDGRWAVIWRGEGGIQMTRTEDDGTSWKDVQNIDGFGKEEGYWSKSQHALLMLGNGFGAVMCVVEEDTGDGPPRRSYLQVAFSRDHGVSWTRPIDINQNTVRNACYVRDPCFVACRDERLLAFWSASMPKDDTVQLDHDLLYGIWRPDSSVWSAETPLNRNALRDVGDDSELQVATDGKGNWIGVWTSTDSLGKTIGYDEDILFARSGDDCKSWSDPASLLPIFQTDQDNHASLAVERSPKIATDGNGLWMSVWHGAGQSPETIGWDDDVMFSLSRDNGKTWTTPEPANVDACDDMKNDEEPQLAYAGDGIWALTWQTTDANTFVSRIRVSSFCDRTASWTPPRELPVCCGINDDKCIHPKIAANQQGKVLVAFVQGSPVGGILDAVIFHSCDRGGSWSDPFVLFPEDVSGDHYSNSWAPVLGIDERGQVVVLFVTENRGVFTIGSRTAAPASDNSASTWANVEFVPADFAPDNPYPDTPVFVRKAGEGRWYAVVGKYGEPPCLKSTYSDSNGATWNGLVRIGEALLSPALATDNQGHWVMLSNQEHRGDLLERTSWEVICRCSSDNAASWSGEALVRRGQPNGQGVFEKWPDIATDGKGCWIAVWQLEMVTSARRENGRVCVSRSEDNGATWSVPVFISERPVSETP